jgi:hypothetical protein
MNDEYKIPQPEGASELREPAVAYCPGVRAAVEPWAVSIADRAEKEIARDAEWQRERKKEWEIIRAWGREAVAEMGVATEEEFMEIVNEEIRKDREEQRLLRNKK